MSVFLMLLIHPRIREFSRRLQDDKQDVEANEGVINSVEYILSELKGLRLKNTAIKV